MSIIYFTSTLYNLINLHKVQQQKWAEKLKCILKIFIISIYGSIHMDTFVYLTGYIKPVPDSQMLQRTW